VWKRPDPQEVKSIIPGVVTSLEIKEGDHVVKGSHIMTFEAMKMQNLVLAPFDGTIEKIFVKEGEKVPKGGIMLFLKSDNEFEIIMDRATSTDLGLIE
jgi:biotin carboxyl carrier protein